VEPHHGASRWGRLRWLARAAAAAVVAAGSVVAVATPAQAAVTSVRIVEDIWYASGMTTTTGAVYCNADEKVLGGGVLVMNLDHKIRLVESWAPSDTWWRWAVYNPTQTVREIHGRAICAKGVSGYERKQSAAYNLVGNSVTTLSASCPAGKTSISGGFMIQAVEYDRGKLKASVSNVSGNGWQAQIRNDSVASYGGFVQVFCTSLGGRTTYSTTVNVAAGSTTYSWEDCGPNKWLVGGGWVTNQNTSSNIVTGALPTDSAYDQWKINLSNPDGAARSVQLVNVCLNK
jgi:hypothetical protein